MFTQRKEFVTLKGPAWFDRQKHAGRCVGTILKTLRGLVDDKIPNLSLKDLENTALKIMEEMDCTPTFKGYQGGSSVPFPSAICTSVNKHLVHGIVTDYVLKDGDVVSFDLGATYKGAVADAAHTSIYGEPESSEVVRMLEACKGALYAGIDAVKVGNRIGAIGNAIHKHVKDTRYALITNYGGHGIDWNRPHAPPFVANRADKNEGVHIQPGLAIAIEPMLVMGDTKTKILDDKWTVEASGISCHFEHSVFVEDENTTHILTMHE